MSDWLSSEDVVRLTGKRRYSAQRRALTEMGIKFIAAHTGEPLVQNTVAVSNAARRRVEPRWDRHA